MENIFINDPKNQAGGIIISDIINDEQIIFLGKSNIKSRKKQYEGFGGKNEKDDISSLHTAIRELIEEFFNIKVSIEIINNIALLLRQSNLILKQQELFGMSYLINLEGLNIVYDKIKDYGELNKYCDNNIFNYQKYFSERIVDGNVNNGLNEIKSIEIFKLDDVKNNKIPLRWYTDKIIHLML